MSTLESAPLTKAEASVVPSVKGLPWWAAVLIGLVPAMVGAFIDIGNHPGDLTRESIGAGYGVLLALGCALAALVVRRRAIFTAMVQPPLVGVVSVTIVLLVRSDVDLGVTTANVYIAIFWPMVIATAITLVLGAIRIFTQSLRPARHT